MKKDWPGIRRPKVATRDAESLFFCGTPTPGLKKLGLQNPTLTPALKNLDSDSDSGPKMRLQLRL